MNNKDAYAIIGRLVIEQEIARQLEEAIGKKNGQQTTASAGEQAARMDQLRTQGRKGCKALRINMAFTPENHRYLKTQARKSGMTITELCNKIITRDRLMREEKA